MHFSFAVEDIDADASCFKFGVTVEGLLDALLDVVGESPRRDLNKIGDAADPVERFYGFGRRRPLILPLEFAAECHSSVLHSDLHGAIRNDSVPLDRVDRASGFVVRAAIGALWTDVHRQSPSRPAPF